MAIKKSIKREVIAPQRGLQTLAMNVQADVIFYGGAAGSGKSRLILMKPLQYIKDPNFEAIFFRRVTNQLTGAGGLWPESKKLYSGFKTKYNEKDMKHQFKSGATLKFSHMELEKNAEDHQGLQYSAIFFDELTHFTEHQFTYLLSRLRSEAEVNSFCMATMNPDPDSWVLHWVEWYLDADGFPRKDRNGTIRYFVVNDGKPVFADNAQELKDKYPELCKVWNPNDETWVEIEPKTFCALFGTIFDNPALIAANPSYLAELKSQPEVERARLLDGNWYYRPAGSNYFKRDWLKKADKVPARAKCCRAWDKASTEPSEVYRQPDYTASTKLWKDVDGYFYITGEYITDVTACDDKDTEVFGKFRKRPGDRDKTILKQAKKDGDDCIIVFPVDPGQAGKTEFEASAKAMAAEGFIVKKDPMPPQKSKLTRFTPFASAAENGLVYIVESSFPNERTLDKFLTELEKFDGTDSTDLRKDDWADSTASAFNFISKELVIPPMKLRQFTSVNNYKMI